MKRVAVFALIIAMCAGCKPVSALPDPSINPTVTVVTGQ